MLWIEIYTFSLPSTNCKNFDTFFSVIKSAPDDGPNHEEICRNLEEKIIELQLEIEELKKRIQELLGSKRQDEEATAYFKTQLGSAEKELLEKEDALRKTQESNKKYQGLLDEKERERYGLIFAVFCCAYLRN